MDKRWFGILLIFIIGLGCMYLIVDHSNTVGKALTVCNEMTITIPDGFTLTDERSNSVTLVNHAKEKISIGVSEEGNDTAKTANEEYKNLKQNGELKITKKTDNETQHRIYYKNLTSDKDSVITFFEKDNRTIKLKMHQYKGYEKDIKFIQNTVVHNFKQNKEME